MSPAKQFHPYPLNVYARDNNFIAGIFIYCPCFFTFINNISYETKLKKGKIESIYKLTMPELFDTNKVKEVELLPSWEKYTYYFDNALSLDQVMEIIDEQNNLLFLYHLIPSPSVLCGHTCCYVSTPEADHMVKISASTDDTGMCDRVHLTIIIL